MSHPPDRPMQRVLVSGISGAGKTTLARRLEQLVGITHIELDALQHGPGWTPRPQFVDDVERFSSGERWTTEDQYHSILGDLLWQRADTVVWLDLPRRVVMRRVIWRTVTRILLRTELYNGNREQVAALRDPGHPVRWSWTQHAARRSETEQLARQHAGVRVVRLRSPRAVRRWLRELAQSVG